MFSNPKRKHVRNGMLSPVDFERQQAMTAEGLENSGLFTMTLSEPQLGSASFKNAFEGFWINTNFCA